MKIYILLTILKYHRTGIMLQFYWVFELQKKKKKPVGN